MGDPPRHVEVVTSAAFASPSVTPNTLPLPPLRSFMAAKSLWSPGDTSSPTVRARLVFVAVVRWISPTWSPAPPCRRARRASPRSVAVCGAVESPMHTRNAGRSSLPPSARPGYTRRPMNRALMSVVACAFVVACAPRPAYDASDLPPGRVATIAGPPGDGVVIVRINDYRCTASMGFDQPCNYREFPGRDPYSLSVKPGRFEVEVRYSLTTDAVVEEGSPRQTTTVESASNKVLRFVAEAGRSYRIDPGANPGGEDWTPTIRVDCPVASEVDQEPCKKAPSW